MIYLLGNTNLFRWIAGSPAHFPRLVGREKNKNKNLASGISEQQEENSMIFPSLPLP
jgi:hypothetical protein